MIELENVDKVYTGKNEDVVALRDVNLKVEQGEIFGIIGKSGAGKSTLLRLVNGLETPSRGTVRVDGREISRLREKELRDARQRIGMIFQHFHLLWSRTVWENVAFPLEVAGKPKREINGKVEQLLERVGLTHRSHAYPSQLSGGQKQRVGIARALANDPRVLLCDEATSALDPETTASILNLLQEINRDTGITMLLITHEMSVVRSICHRVAVMDEGQIVETGETGELFRSPQHPVTRQFVRQILLEEGKPDIPEGENRPGNGEPAAVIQCVFPDGAKNWAVLEECVRREDLTVHILHGELSRGSRIALRLTGGKEAIQQSVSSLEASGAQVEVVADV